MARKAYNGYPEKSYYDNTMYNGIVATGDPLNEGSFALITNFDISDSGKSLIPRLGYLTTLFEVGGVPVRLSDEVIMYREPNVGRHVIMDLNELDTDKGAYLVDVTQYNIVDNLIANGHRIVNYDTKDLVEYFFKQVPALEHIPGKVKHIFSRSTPQGTTNLSPIIDLNGVTQYIIKMKYKKPEDPEDPEDSGELDYWLKVMYREKENPRIEEDNLADTLIFGVIDMSEQTTNFLNRNIASSVSLIPDPIRYMETASDDLADSNTDVNRPILLKVNDKYTTQRLPISFKTSLDIKVDPTFYLQNPVAITGNEDTAKWAYRFDIVSTSKLTDFPVYKTPWRTINTLDGTNPIIPELDLDSVGITKEKYTYYILGEGATNVSSSSRLTTDPIGLLNEETEMFKELADGGVVASNQITELGDLVFAYTKHKAIADSFTKNVRTFTDVDNDLFTQLKLYFVSEDTIKAGVVKYSVPYDNLANRTRYVENSRPKPPGYETTEDPMFSPGFMISGEDYAKMDRMTPTQFALDAMKKSEDYEIEVVYMPFVSYIKTYDTSNELVDETVYLLSLGGIFAGGMFDYPTATNIPEYSLVLNVPKKYMFFKEPAFKTINLWNNFTTLNINKLLPKVPRSVFDKGVSLILYLHPYNTDELEDLQGRNYNRIKTANAAWDAASYTQSVIATWGADKDVTYIDDIQDDDAEIITTANKGIVFENRLVLWNANKVYISEEGNYNYFTNKMKKEFPEEVLKIISFKTILLVFTTQHLYAIHRVEAETPTGNFDEEGVPEVALEVIWIHQPVLYNINPERRYLDVIQVYNQMVLFYSNEGQLYMIRPSTTIDNETQFGIQYFNKSANAVLANFHEYITGRLYTYNKVEQLDEHNQVKKDDVQIKAIVDIDTIRIIYFVPDKITFILNYDVVNNRYTTYDTLSFTDVLSTNHVEGGEMYITKENYSSYFTLPISRFNDVDLNVDMHYSSSFKKEPIFTLLDSGNLNLNNHITKRMRDLKIVMKNIDSSKILYNAEVLMDDTVIYPFYNNMFNVRMSNGPDSRIVVDKVPVDDMNDLFGLTQTIGFSGARTNMNSYYLYDDNDFFNKNSLLKTETLNSNKLIEYNSSITSMGKVVRIKIQLISKGKYKLQSFGIVYKERRI